MNKSSFGTMLNSLVPISHLNQGKAAKIISSLGPDDVKIIVKNNEPMAAIVPISRFSELIRVSPYFLRGMLQDKTINRNSNRSR